MRIAAMADLHGHLPEIPPCDLLIIAGDVCPDRIGGVWAEASPERQARWFAHDCGRWLASSPAPVVLTWGNHDWCGQALQLWADDPRIVVDRVTTVAGLKIWASPWSNQFGGWAFMKDPIDLAPIYESIPDDVDIIVSHGPPYGYGDENLLGQHCGSLELLAAIDRVKPKLVVCGHIHEAAGVYRHTPTTLIINASVVNEMYQLVRPATMVEMGLRTAFTDKELVDAGQDWGD
jgi:Icc-related predicted phosphoesterase